VVGRKSLPLAFRAREGLCWVYWLVLVGANPLYHSNHEWDGASWQEKPELRVGGCRNILHLVFRAREMVVVARGRESPPSLEL